MRQFIRRMQVEAKGLSNKITKLTNFIESDRFERLTSSQQVLLTEQLKHMSGYLGVLGQRIDLESE